MLRQVVTPTTTVMQAQVTVFSAVSSHNLSDEILAMCQKGKVEEFLFAPPSHTIDANAFMHEELTELLIYYNTALPSSQEHIYGGGHCTMPPTPVPLFALPFSKKNQINGAK